jgi:uncharacterized OB-fold protein
MTTGEPKSLDASDATGDSRFWAAAEVSRLEFQVCQQCGYIRWPAAGVCPECLSREAVWQTTGNEGTVWSFVVYHHAYGPALKSQVPYNVALVELDNGVKLITRIVGVSDSEIRVGMRVRAGFEPIGDRPSAPVFCPVGMPTQDS